QRGAAPRGFSCRQARACHGHALARDGRERLPIAIGQGVMHLEILGTGLLEKAQEGPAETDAAFGDEGVPMVAAKLVDPLGESELEAARAVPQAVVRLHLAQGSGRLAENPGRFTQTRERLSQSAFP